MLSLLLLPVLPGCSLVQGFFAWIGPPDTGTVNAPMRESVLLRLTPTVRPVLEPPMSVSQTTLTQAQASVDSVKALYKHHLAVTALTQPWDGLGQLERQGLLLAELSEGRAINLPVLLDVLEAGMDRTSAFHKPVGVPASISIKDLVAFMLESLEQASIHREKAMVNLTEEERRFLFHHSQVLAEQFTPQVSGGPE